VEGKGVEEGREGGEGSGEKSGVVSEEEERERGTPQS